MVLSGKSQLSISLSRYPEYAYLIRCALNRYWKLPLKKKTLEVKRLAAATISSLKEKRSDDTIWDDLLKKAGVSRTHTSTQKERIDEANSTVHYDSTPEDMYRRYYFEILDRLIGEIERRFESPSS